MPNLEVTKSIDVDASPDVVFRALTDEKELSHWMPQEAKMDARVGGRLEFKYRRPDTGNELIFQGEILEMVQDKRLSYTYHFPTAKAGQAPGPSPRTVVTWTLERLPGGRTRVKVVHSGFFTGLAKYAEEGWARNLEQLAEFLRRAVVLR